MSYVEYLRVRHAFFVFAAIIVAVVVAMVVSIHVATFQHGHAGVRIRVDVGSHTHAAAPGETSDITTAPIPLGMLLGIAGFIAAAFSTVLASSLNRENERADFVFTKPVSRPRLALAYMAVDLAAIVAAYVFALVVLCLVPLASVGLLRAIFVDAQAIPIAFLGIAIALLWYGVLQAVTAGYRGRGGTLVGFSWLAFLLLSSLASLSALGPIFHGIVMFLNLANPFAYFSGLTTGSSLRGDVVVGSVFNLPVETRAVVAGSMAILSCAVAIFAWKRVEA